METRTLIIVEDHALVRELYADAMRRAGYRVIERPTARDLVELVRREQPRAVVLDVSLPGESGLEACRKLKDDPTTRHTRVILLTAHASLETARAAAEAGAEQFLLKPLPPVALFAAIERPRPNLTCGGSACSS
jgi:two-component system cell cycle response regulator